MARQEHEGVGRQARHWIERLTRLGFASKSLLYLVVAGLCLRAALGSPEAEGPLGAVAAIARTPVGRILLVAAVPGFAAYCVWRVMQAIFDPEGLGHGFIAVVVRIGNGVTGLVYGGLCAIVVRELLGVEARAFGFLRRTFAPVLESPLGAVLLGVFGLILIGVGLVQLQTAVTARFLETLELERFRPRARTGVRWLGRAAFTLWGVVFGLMGWFALEAAFTTGQVSDARSIGGTLRTVEQQPYEPWPLLLLAGGFAAFAVYAAIEARWRTVRAA